MSDGAPATDPAAFSAAFAPLAAIGRNPETGGYNRFAWTPEDRDARAWFEAEALCRGAGTIETDRNGNLWAWWGDPAGAGAIATGSHLDTVPEGGAYDGALGVVTGLLAAETCAPDARVPLAVCAFADEEGARFGVACVGSKLLTGALAPPAVVDRVDTDGVTLAEAVAAFGVDPEGLGQDADRTSRLAAFVEVHVEQGRQLDRVGRPLAAATGIWPHGRWRAIFRGEANHAGTTLLDDRRDPMLPFGAFVVAAREAASAHGALTTVARVEVEPNGTNVIPSRVTAWLDARAPDDATLDAVVTAATRAVPHGDLVEESRTPAVAFDADLLGRLAMPTAIGTGAGHDAGVLAAVCPTGMVFVRNPTGVSHSPHEHATDADCAAGVDALVSILRRLTA